MILRNILISSLFLPFVLGATELKPWFNNSFQIESRSSAEYQYFKKVATSAPEKKYRSNDLFLNQSFTIYKEQYAAEVETKLAATRAQKFNIDCLKLTGRYQLSDDVIGDAFSSVAGLTVTQAGRPALYDPASFHHGLVNLEAHLALGKEAAAYYTWLRRYFAVVGVGISSGPPQSKPWIRADFGYNFNCKDVSQLDFFVNNLIGFGRHKLKLNSFRGYGPVAHRSVDVGVRYSYLLNCIGGILTGEYAYRVYAKNFPKNVSRVKITFYYPFGI